MQFPSEIRHFDENFLSKYADNFKLLRQEMSLIDLSITTKGGTVIPAHKIVLCAQFPGIKNTILNSGNLNLTNWSRFPHDVVMAVVDFAYTGEITISAENVLGMYLMAHNLGCNTLINWTTDFIKTRLNQLNLMEVWSAGNVTSNTDLISVCIPRIACDFDRLASSQHFLQHIGVDQLTLLLQSPWICDGNEATKFKALCTWLHASSSTVECLRREKHLDRLLKLINMNKLPKKLVIKTLESGSGLTLSENARKTILDTFLDSNETKRMKTKMSIFVHVGKDDSSSDVLAAVPELSGGRNLSFPLILPSKSCTVELDGFNQFQLLTLYYFILFLVGSVYTLGGKDKSGESTSRVEVINPLNGEVTVVQPMIEERDAHSAVARDQAILVFGGYNTKSETILDSCEKFNPATNTWVELPQMPTPRYATGAAHIPGVGEIVVGGRTKAGLDAPGVDNAEIFLTNSSPLGYAGSWCKITPMLKLRTFPSAEFFNGKVYVAGSCDNSTTSVEVLSIFTAGPLQWTEVTNAPLQPYSMIAFNGNLLFATVRGRIYELLLNQDDENSSSQKYSWKLISVYEHTRYLQLLKINEHL